MTGPANGDGRAEQPHDARPANISRTPDCVIVVSQLRGQPWSDSKPLDEALQTGRTPAHEAEADWVAEP